MRGSALGPASCPANAQEQFANPYVAAEHGHVDALIQPRDIRRRMIAALKMLSGKRDEISPKQHENFPLCTRG
jgi:acetyl-CoA carboxylase carboxyltransferase component